MMQTEFPNQFQAITADPVPEQCRTQGRPLFVGAIGATLTYPAMGDIPVVINGTITGAEADAAQFTAKLRPLGHPGGPSQSTRARTILRTSTLVKKLQT
ncbi:MAG: hypothetical protein ACLTF5_08490 [Butyricicoccus sp.]